MEIELNHKVLFSVFLFAMVLVHLIAGCLLADFVAKTDKRIRLGAMVGAIVSLLGTIVYAMFWLRALLWHMNDIWSK